MWLIMLLLAVCGIWAVYESSAAHYALARLAYSFDPSATRAYEYASRHFSTAHPDTYNIDYAEYFYREAIEQNVDFASAHHQIARIEFLRGNLFSALESVNREIEIAGDTNAHAYYVRGLIRGFSGDYARAADDFRFFLSKVPGHWAATNDLAWVLMRNDQYTEARRVLAEGLAVAPDNAWLLNSYAIALYEEGDYEQAHAVAVRAQAAVALLTPEEWSRANPGNDPKIARDGLENFRATTMRNVEVISHQMHQ